MRRNRTMAAILGSLALVLFISSPVFAEGEADSGTPTSAEVVAPETPAEPETPPSTPDTPEPETPSETPASSTPDSPSTSSSSSSPTSQESTPSSNSNSSSSNNSSSSSNKNDAVERSENNTTNNNNRSSSSSRGANTSKSNNTRLSSVKFAGHGAVLSDGIFLVADPSIDVRDKTKITLKAENSSAKAEVVDQKIEDENTAIYTIKVTAENGKTRDYTLRVVKSETKSAATTTAAAASSTGSTTDNTSAKKGNALAKFLFIFGFMVAAGGFAAFLVIRDYKKKNGIDDDLPFSDDDNNIRYKKALAWRRIPESTDVRLGRRGMPEEIPEDVLNELRGK